MIWKYTHRLKQKRNLMNVAAFGALPPIDQLRHSNLINNEKTSVLIRNSRIVERKLDAPKNKIVYVLTIQ